MHILYLFKVIQYLLPIDKCVWCDYIGQWLLVFRSVYVWLFSLSVLVYILYCVEYTVSLSYGFDFKFCCFHSIMSCPLQYLVWCWQYLWCCCHCSWLLHSHCFRSAWQLVMMMSWNSVRNPSFLCVYVCVHALMYYEYTWDCSKVHICGRLWNKEYGIAE